MRFRLRSLLIALALLPPVLAVGWGKYAAWHQERHRRALQKRLDEAAEIGVDALFRVLHGEWKRG